MNRNFLLLPFTFLLASCVTMGGLAEVIEQAAKSDASICGEIVGGGGAIIVAPGAAIPVIPGGGGYGRARFCRTNEPGSEIEVKPDGTLKIKHGIDKPTVVFVLPREPHGPEEDRGEVGVEAPRASRLPPFICQGPTCL